MTRHWEMRFATAFRDRYPFTVETTVGKTKAGKDEGFGTTGKSSRPG
jgi:hypothetical protein